LNAGEGLLPLREWPLENFIALAKKLLEEFDSTIIFVGTDGAKRKAQELLKSLNSSRCMDLTGRTTLEELMTIFDIAEALISNDCGLVHLAMLTPIKKFIFFGPESPKVLAPWEKTPGSFILASRVLPVFLF